MRLTGAVYFPLGYARLFDWIRIGMKLDWWKLNLLELLNGHRFDLFELKLNY